MKLKNKPQATVTKPSRFEDRYPLSMEMSDVDCKMGVCWKWRQDPAFYKYCDRLDYVQLIPKVPWTLLSTSETFDRVQVTYHCPNCKAKKILREGIYLCLGGPNDGQRVPSSFINRNEYIQYNLPQRGAAHATIVDYGTYYRWEKHDAEDKADTPAVYIHISLLPERKAQ